MLKKIYSVLIKFYIRIYNLLYQKISSLATKLNDGIHPKHEIMKYSLYFLENIEKNNKVLDIGCGIGIVSYELAKKAREVVSIDINVKSIIKAKEKYNYSKIKYIIGDATTYNFNETFDAVILSNVLEHIKDRVNFLKKIRYLSDIFLIRVPMINRSWLSLYQKRLGLNYKLDRTHFVEYTFESFQKELTLANLKIVTYKIKYGEIWAKVKLL